MALVLTIKQKVQQKLHERPDCAILANKTIKRDNRILSNQLWLLPDHNCLNK
jgi:hypothetical protein